MNHCCNHCWLHCIKKSIAYVPSPTLFISGCCTSFKHLIFSDLTCTCVDQINIDQSILRYYISVAEMRKKIRFIDVRFAKGMRFPEQCRYRTLYLIIKDRILYPKNYLVHYNYMVHQQSTHGGKYACVVFFNRLIIETQLIFAKLRFSLCFWKIFWKIIKNRSNLTIRPFTTYHR